MFKKYLTILTTTVFVFSSTLSFAQPPRNRNADRVKRSSEPMQISQAEYDSKIKTANTFLITGAITGGVGLALTVTGTALWAQDFSNALSGGSSSKSTATAGAYMLFAGLPMMLAGGGLAIAGGLKKSNTKRSYYTFSPIIDLKNELYGANLLINF